MERNRQLALAAWGAAGMILLAAALADGLPMDPCPVCGSGAVAPAGQVIRLAEDPLWRLCCLEGIGPARAGQLRAQQGDPAGISGISRELMERWSPYIELDTIQ